MNAADGSGHGHDGAVEGAQWTPAGRFGGALRFDGVDDLVSVPDADALDLAAGGTWEAWAKPTELGDCGVDRVLHRGGDPDNGYAGKVLRG